MTIGSNHSPKKKSQKGIHLHTRPRPDLKIAHQSQQATHKTTKQDHTIQDLTQNSTPGYECSWLCHLTALKPSPKIHMQRHGTRDAYGSAVQAKSEGRLVDQIKTGYGTGGQGSTTEQEYGSTRMRHQVQPGTEDNGAERSVAPGRQITNFERLETLK